MKVKMTQKLVKTVLLALMLTYVYKLVSSYESVTKHVNDILFQNMQKTTRCNVIDAVQTQTSVSLSTGCVMETKTVRMEPMRVWRPAVVSQKHLCACIKIWRVATDMWDTVIQI